MKRALLGLFVLLIVIQFVPVDRANPDSDPALALRADSAVQDIFQRSCFDCHSNKSSWPWYSYVAPVSWLVADHVHEGRKELNFSVWNTYSPKRQSKKLKEIVEELEEGEMPLPPYLITHPDAAMSESDIQLIRMWAAQTDTMYVETEKAKE